MPAIKLDGFARQSRGVIGLNGPSSSHLSLCFSALERLIMSALPSHMSPLDWNSTNSSCWTGRKSSYLILSLLLPSLARKRSSCLLYTSCK